MYEKDVFVENAKEVGFRREVPKLTLKKRCCAKVNFACSKTYTFYMIFW
jgi:hypothetical protein